MIRRAGEPAVGSSPCPMLPHSPSQLRSFARQNESQQPLCTWAKDNADAGNREDCGPETLCGSRRAASFLCVSAHLLHHAGNNILSCLFKM